MAFIYCNIIIPIGIINLVKVVIVPSLFSNNLINPEDNIHRNNVNWGYTQSLPEPDVIINDNSIVVEAELFPDIDKIKEEHKKEIQKYNKENKKLSLENKELNEIINMFREKTKLIDKKIK